MKATAIAPTNIAFIKYWGKKDPLLRLPTNESISMNLSSLTTTTTVEFSPKWRRDRVVFVDQKIEKRQVDRVVEHLQRIRKIAGLKLKAQVVSSNSFPADTGLSSSASAFAALTLAAARAAKLNLSEKELTILARLGSGSACRSIPDGFVEWKDGDTHKTSYAVSLFPPSYWDIYDIVAIISDTKKEISTTQAMQQAFTSPFFPLRIKNIKKKIIKLKQIMRKKDFSSFGELIENEALEMHAVMITSAPPLIYWLPETLKLIKLTAEWRKLGVSVYFTLNTGQNVHLITDKKNKDRVLRLINKVKEVKQVIVNCPSVGARIINHHLF